MITALTKQNGRLDLASLKALETAELRSELSNALKLTAHHLSYLAAIWGELERRGEDLSALKNGIGKYLAMIAAGTVLAETVVAFAGEPMLLARAAKLPIAEQKKAIEAGALPLPKNRVENYQREISSRGIMRRVPIREETACQQPVVKLEQMAAVASPRDVMEMCLNMIRASADPKDVAQRLAPELEKIIAKKKRSILD